MLRILFGVVALALFLPEAFACDGQTGKVIFEDTFTRRFGRMALWRGKWPSFHGARSHAYAPCG